MLKKVICTWAVLIFLIGAALTAGAEEFSGEVLVWLRDGEKVITDGSLEIYHAGDPVPEGYLLGPEFGGGIIAGADVPSGEFAHWMADRAGPGILGIPDGNGMIWFKGLAPGMYLIRQGQAAEGYLPVEPYLACVSEELCRVDTYPKLRRQQDLPKTGQRPDAYLGILGSVSAMTGLIFWLQRRKQII